MKIDPTYAEHRTNILPLRWFANLCGFLSSGAILRLTWAEETEDTKGFRYKLNTFMWDTLWPIYQKYGTTYRFYNDLSGSGWDDYDAYGIPYWEKTGTLDPDYRQPWKFVDPWTGDAFRLVIK